MEMCRVLSFDFLLIFWYCLHTSLHTLAFALHILIIGKVSTFQKPTLVHNSLYGMMMHDDVFFCIYHSNFHSVNFIFGSKNKNKISWMNGKNSKTFHHEYMHEHIKKSLSFQKRARAQTESSGAWVTVYLVVVADGDPAPA